MLVSLPSHCTPLRWMGASTDGPERSSNRILYRKTEYTKGNVNIIHTNISSYTVYDTMKTDQLNFHMTYMCIYVNTAHYN